MRLSELVLWLLDMPPCGWRLLARIVRVYQQEDPALREALLSQVELLERMAAPERKTRASGLCYNPSAESMSALLMPNGRGGLYVMAISTTRLSTIDPIDREAA